MRGYAAALNRCPRRGCDRPPMPIFCVQDWELISNATKRKLLVLWKAMRGHRVRGVPEGLTRLLEAAVREINAAPKPKLNKADRLALAIHAAVVGAS